MKIDLHCHSKYSCDNSFDPQRLIQEAALIGLDGICITEHDSVEASKPYANLETPEGFLIFRAVEISTQMGHMLAYGLEDDSWDQRGRFRYIDLETAVLQVKQRGGICVPSHPFRGVESMGECAFDQQLFDAVETINGNNYFVHNNRAVDYAKNLNMTGVGGSDCHGPGQVGRAYTQFERPVYNIRDIAEEIKQGRCKAVLAS
ncbi:MAG: PHP domain-containing protein [Desulfobacteraceae bacterium]|nr:PHP domain-containing protein [Desulfobacteraceae bacterium]